eukprot:gene16784-biopygen8283
MHLSVGGGAGSPGAPGGHRGGGGRGLAGAVQPALRGGPSPTLGKIGIRYFQRSCWTMPSPAGTPTGRGRRNRAPGDPVGYGQAPATQQSGTAAGKGIRTCPRHARAIALFPQGETAADAGRTRAAGQNPKGTDADRTRAQPFPPNR